MNNQDDGIDMIDLHDPMTTKTKKPSSTGPTG